MRTAGPFREDLLGKGSILADSNEDLLLNQRLHLELNKAAFQKNELNAGDVVHLCSDLQFVDLGRIRTCGYLYN